MSNKLFASAFLISHNSESFFAPICTKHLLRGGGRGGGRAAAAGRAGGGGRSTHTPLLFCVPPPQPLHLPFPASQLLCHQLYITVKADSQQQQQTAEMHLCTNSLRRHRRHSSSVMARELWLPCDITLTLLGTKSIYVHERAEGVRKWHSALVGSG